MSNHAGPAALYVTMPLAHDMIGLYFAVGSSNHLPPWGGSESLLGTNPMAVAVPALDEPPIVLDMAPTVAAYGKVRLKAQRGEQMPVGWMIDRDGKPLTDPKRADEGHLLPIGDYKGYGLSLIIGLLAGALNRAALGRDVIDFVKETGKATNTGQAIAAISVETFMPPAEFKRAVDQVIRDIRNSRRLPGVERIWLPGEQSHAKLLERRAHGVPMPKALRESLDARGARSQHRAAGLAPWQAPHPVGVIGLGLMGEVYARRLIAAGFAVIGFDVDPAKNERLDSDRRARRIACRHRARLRSDRARGVLHRSGRGRGRARARSRRGRQDRDLHLDLRSGPRSPRSARGSPDSCASSKCRCRAPASRCARATASA